MAQIEYAYKINNSKAANIAEMLYVLAVREGIRKKSLTISEGVKELKELRKKTTALCLLLKRDLYRLKTRKKKTLKSN